MNNIFKNEIEEARNNFEQEKIAIEKLTNKLKNETISNETFFNELTATYKRYYETKKELERLEKGSNNIIVINKEVQRLFKEQIDNEDLGEYFQNYLTFILFKKDIWKAQDGLFRAKHYLNMYPAFDYNQYCGSRQESYIYNQVRGIKEFSYTEKGFIKEYIDKLEATLKKYPPVYELAKKIDEAKNFLIDWE